MDPECLEDSPEYPYEEPPFNGKWNWCSNIVDRCPCAWANAWGAVSGGLRRMTFVNNDVTAFGTLKDLMADCEVNIKWRVGASNMPVRDWKVQPPTMNSFSANLQEMYYAYLSIVANFISEPNEAYAYYAGQFSQWVDPNVIPILEADWAEAVEKAEKARRDALKKNGNPEGKDNKITG
jgi:hypothetical protein